MPAMRSCFGCVHKVIIMVMFESFNGKGFSLACYFWLKLFIQCCSIKIYSRTSGVLFDSCTQVKKFTFNVFVVDKNTKNIYIICCLCGLPSE